MKKIQSLWATYFLQCEFFLSLILGIALSVWVWKYHGDSLVDVILKGNRAPVYGAFAAIFGSLLGFVITAVSIILSFASSPQLTIVRESEHYRDLWQVFISAIHFLGFATIIALGGLIFDRDDTPTHWLLCLCTWVFVIATFRLIRCIWVF